jgi:ubiquinone/menaquinone biosynthesis C-methylase UbiE
MTKENEIKKYVQFYSTTLGKRILAQETRFVDEKLRGRKKVLSIGCSPALLEARLHLLHPDMNIIGLDNSKVMIKQASKEISIVYGAAQHLEFEDSSFDAVSYVTSLEFIQSVQKAIKEAYRVLQLKGLLLVLMINQNSRYFQEKYNNNNSYMRKNIKQKHTNINKIQKVISQYFIIKNEEYFLGINEQEIVDTDDYSNASLYVLEGKRL